jgi:hypothetical protein
MVYLCRFCEHYQECVEQDTLVCRCKYKNQEIHRWFTAGKVCFSDRRKNTEPWDGEERRKREQPALHRVHR